MQILHFANFVSTLCFIIHSKQIKMFKLLSLVLLVSFLFASSLKEIKLIVNSKGNLTIVNKTVYSASKNVSFAPECTPVEANANSPPNA